MNVCKECGHDLDKCSCSVDQKLIRIMATEDRIDSYEDSAKALAEAHWSYIESLLDAHGEHGPNIDKVKFHYISAFIHGYKHAVEDCTYGEA